MATEPSDAGARLPPPWDLVLYTSAYTLADASSATADDCQRHADAAWQRLLARKPLLYLPDRSPHGDCDARAPGRRLWRRDELLAFDARVEQRTRALLELQRAALLHWRDAATRIQAHTRGLLARRRVERMRQQLFEAAQAAARARDLAALRARQLYAAVRIQTAYHRRCARVRYVFTCRRRVHDALRRYAFRWQRQRAARVLQRAFRAFRRRVALAKALGTLLRLLQLSRQRAQLEAATSAFRAARHATREKEKARLWQRHPLEMTNAARVHARKTMLKSTHPDATLPRLPRSSALPRANPSRPRPNQAPSPASRLPRLGSPDHH